MATSFRALYQLHARSPEERRMRNKHAEKLIATWGTCDLWLKMFPEEEDDPEDIDLFAVGITLSSRVKDVMNEVATSGNSETVGRFYSFPEAFWPSTDLTPKSKSKTAHPPPEILAHIMRYSIYGTDAPEVLQYPDEAAFKSASLVCRAWNSAVRGEVDRKCHLSGMSRVFSRFLYETHSHTFSRRKTGLSDLHIDLSFGNARLPGSIVSIVEALAITSPLRNLHLSRVSIDSMRIVKLIAQCPALKHVGFSKCSFERGVDVEDHSVHLARQQLQQVTSAVIQGNSEWEWEEGDSFMKFLAGSLAPTLRSLVLSQQLHLTLDLPQLECLDFTLVPGSVALSSLPKLKHLRVEDNGSLKYVAPLTVDLHILEARMFWEMVEDYNDYYTALASLPALRVLDVEDFNRESPEALVPTEPHIAFYRRMGPSLRGFLIDVKSTHRPLLWCVGVHCRQLTHVGICCGSPEGPPLIGVDDITAFVRGCAKLRKVSVYGWNQDLVQEVAAALREVEGVDLLVGRTCPQVTSWWFS